MRITQFELRKISHFWGGIDYCERYFCEKFTNKSATTVLYSVAADYVVLCL